MIVCESEFNIEDSENIGYSLCEVDFYAWVPENDEVPNHRLSLRKNLNTGEYELYRHYVIARLKRWYGLTIVTNKDDMIQDEVIFSSTDLQKVLDRGKEEWDKFHVSWAKQPHERDLVCTHKYPTKSMLCKMVANR